MATCKECTQFFLIPEGADDYAAGKADCVMEKEDEKGKYWLSKPVFENTEQCDAFRMKR
ncbi:Benzylsuccinate synthase gamma subunit [Georgfuchsia toluolica]|uniref:Benzylsuccinate synthase gamma subunit n=1 Tax=Georgfuchsia toluolica TaxID=424218 RepID=A0A916J1L1_9PROT|nr:benzylsuccinate synthase gamma subunit family protein [Georgfuchsia toluolica]CAG4882136.1 Benzylsuccinate synthase gamma subunit [Georgfuchsia toluolica]CAG4885446.1 Benzylsuccinate synthase gamma subunit [Georgfuchsia toluolica]